ncbi:Hsp70 family protein [Stackebrandtia nassauensis]|uniref:Heat shock protein 70 n=1 Tax=Stackebrandtia nassauensis (strain DSM 44728 / CIP 108903 / NRRL B-16338 / NBRC 102104 / LLR-40K-21) TaxID=446470 RepID=D3Q489_STANL|nr:Hsp70 family protein [Stackebrandtia nassauensis]ADD45974.1 heat shock protein 70 [Stackebrandtia nassauensis DSM 44728]
MRSGYRLGVDVGTSHTVAVLRHRDGRVKPLLWDGSPVLPSAVFCDEQGNIHVGRDAQRLAQVDPTRFEPNPKQRIDDGTVLLGDRELRPDQLLTAILSRVAAKAWESGAKDTEVVLTVPSKWATRRRDLLSQAALWAGLGEVRLVTEPVAAAHYYVDSLGQRLGSGGSIAVFDFGGGTLDIAVVRYGSNGFTVASDGGLSDLGGLDLDAALIEHVGKQLQPRSPTLWRQLTRPATGWDRRIRRQFWEDVRGAKEMLSRSSQAPIAVPGGDETLHITRGELESVATPLLRRAVDETARVIEGAGLTPQHLSGLFLVGGSSRVPLVSRMLHQRLDISPTILEQPELPVAEGSLTVAQLPGRLVVPEPTPTADGSRFGPPYQG